MAPLRCLFTGGERSRLSDRTFHRVIQMNEESTMPQSTHDRVAELHNLAAHAHAAAATAHGKGDHLTARELSRQAHEYSANAHKHSEDVAAKIGTSGKD